mmetsp:Transcript_155124/g.476523  ORF Transcript_155124/g.476523 Transcript_155124/m.476523 type:complete len:97 (-) Transcript_155124:15-305(-)
MSQAAGSALLAVGAVCFAYFTAWILLLPMWAPEDAPWLHLAFPPRRWALVVPGLAFATFIAGLVAFVGVVIAGALPQRLEDPQEAHSACAQDGKND